MVSLREGSRRLKAGRVSCGVVLGRPRNLEGLRRLGAVVDELSLAQTQADLVAWGLLDYGPPVALTRRGRAALARAAAFLREEELAGRARTGHPLVLAAEIAVAAAVPDGVVASPEHHRYLAAVELASLPEGVREMFL